jgi:hypothetical protein
LQSFSERAQDRAVFVREAANAHTEAAAAREASLQAKTEAAQEIKHLKEALACQAEKEVNSLKKKLEAAQQKAKDTADDLQVVADGALVWSLGVIFISL